MSPIHSVLTLSLLCYSYSFIFCILDGLYVLLRPEKNKGPRSYAPRHLEHLLEKEFRQEFVQWSLSGPQFPQPTAIQQRYCYPKGEHEYCYRKGGSLWTMYGPDGKENCDYRLLHVYFSTKRAQNKGVSNIEIEEEHKRQRDDVSMASESIGSMSSSTKKRRKMSRIAVERSIPSPWQQPPATYPYPVAMAATPPDYRQSPGVGYNLGYSRHQPSARVPPPSPCRSQQFLNAPRSGPPMYISPNSVSAASQQGIDYDYPNSGDHFDHQPFHPMTSWDVEDVDASIGALVATGDSAQRECQEFGNPPRRPEVFRPRAEFEIGHVRRDSNAQVQHFLDDENFETSLVDLEHAWETDPELGINMTFSKDAREVAEAHVPRLSDEMESAERLVRRLEDLHDKIRQGVLAHPPEERAALVGIVASWAREIARSPLAPLPQGEAHSTKLTVEAGGFRNSFVKKEGEEDSKSTVDV
jgi:hypothetical protein